MALQKLDIKNSLGYFLKKMTNIFSFDTSSIGINKCDIINSDIVYFIENFDTDSSLYLIFNNPDAYCMSFNEYDSNKFHFNKYLIFANTVNNN